MKFVNNLDINKNQLIKAKLEMVAGDPVGLDGSDEGRVWFDTAADQIKVYGGGLVQKSTNVLETLVATAPIALSTVIAKSQTISIAPSSATVDGSMSTANYNKLAGIAAGGTANSTDVFLLARANHTGTQTSATISGFDTDVDARVVAGIIGKAPINAPTFTGVVAGVTATHVGLGSVNNTTDAAKPVSAATQTALNLKADLVSPTFTGTVNGISKAAVGLSNVDNTTDAAKPVSTLQAAADALKAPIASPTFTGTVGGVTATHVGLANVNNTTDLLKPLSTAAIAESAVAKARASHTGTQLAATISDFATTVNATKLNSLAAPIASLAMGSQLITGLLDPVSAQDAATKNYVDGVAQGLDVKASVRVATIATVGFYTNNTGPAARGQLTTCPMIVDGVNLVAGTILTGNRILVKNHTTPAANGIYVVTTLGTGATGIWDRATDFDKDSEVTAGSFTFVSEGTQQSSGWVNTTDNPIIVGGVSGSALVFAQFSGAGTYLAGTGLSLSGNTFNVGGTANRITSTGTTVDISTAYVGQATITTVGTIGAGTWASTDVGIAYGGTGASDAINARANLGAVGKFAASFGDGAAAGTVYTITHNLNSLDVQVEIFENTGGASVLANVTHLTVNTITVTSSAIVATNALRAVVIG
jgi:hypothetical protein